MGNSWLDIRLRLHKAIAKAASLIKWVHRGPKVPFTYEATFRSILMNTCDVVITYDPGDFKPLLWKVVHLIFLIRVFHQVIPLDSHLTLTFIFYCQMYLLFSFHFQQFSFVPNIYSEFPCWKIFKFQKVFLGTSIDTTELFRRAFRFIARIYITTRLQKYLLEKCILIGSPRWI